MIGLVTVLLLAGLPQDVPETHLLVVTGLGGEPRYSESFHEWGVSLVTAARESWGLPESNVTFLAEKPEVDPERITGRSTRDEIEGVLDNLSGRMRPGDQLFIVLIGHGSMQGGESRFNLPGPDMTASDFARLLDRFAAQRVVFVNTASSSGGFVEALSGENRTIVTATRSGRERNETLFGRYFVEAYASDAADTDKNGRVSVLEAFEYARREVARVYESEHRILTEHALLDDDGDGRGTAEPDVQASDGSIAASIYLAGPASAAVAAGRPDDPRLAALYDERDELERRIAELRRRKAELELEAYERQLEELLVDLALKTREIRELEEREP